MLNKNDLQLIVYSILIVIIINLLIPQILGPLISKDNVVNNIENKNLDFESLKNKLFNLIFISYRQPLSFSIMCALKVGLSVSLAIILSKLS